MGFISLSNVFFSYDSFNNLLDGVSVVFHDNETVAIIGDNGTGKTTLLKLLSGQLVPDSGQITNSATTYLLNQIHAPNSRSGGERQSHELARAFDSGAQILLLDEPTNNLDSDACASFFDKLASYPYGCVIVSHDRELLQRVDKILEISHGKISVFGGNYDFYVTCKHAIQSKLASDYTAAGKEIARLRGTLCRAQNTCQHHDAKQKKDKHNLSAGSKMAANALKGKSQETESKKRNIIQKKLNKQLDIQQALSNDLRDDKIKIPVPNKPFYGRELIRITNLCFSYGARQIFNKFNFAMNGGSRIRICGKNGSGKSTLLRLICGELRPDSGTICTHCKIAYLTQDLSLLDKNKSIVENIMDIADIPRHDAHAIAANFGFRGDKSHQIVSSLSGGELLKATLASVLGNADQPDLLILDEPTNNLEIKSIAILEDALNQYRGAILLVSHDETFVQNINIDDHVCLTQCDQSGAGRTI